MSVEGHEAVWKELPWHVAGTLDDATRAAVERHLAGCEACRREVEHLRRVARAVDGGATWALVTEGLDDWRVRDLAVSPEGALYLSTEEAVWRYEGETRAVALDGGGAVGADMGSGSWTGDSG